jgi:N-acetylmuramic acid 6-phosphate etherase
MTEKSLAEQNHPDSQDLDTLPTAQILNLMNLADQEVPHAVGRELARITRAVDAIAATLEAGGRLFYIGAGTSGRLGVLDASECPPTFHVPPELVQGIIAGGDSALRRSSESAEDNPSAGARDLLAAGFRQGDAVVGIASSGGTPYVLGAIRKARELGGVTCGIACTPNAELSSLVEFPMEPAPGPEILTGSTRLRAGTATKLVLNMISTAVMIKLGYVYGNLMVNVQPSNRKLERRAVGIIQQLTGTSSERAAELLEQSGRSVRTAIVMEKKNVTRHRAEHLLAQSKGRIREALK